jgi:hypothetical protein
MAGLPPRTPPSNTAALIERRALVAGIAGIKKARPGGRAFVGS